jgi:hypothetical protein
MGLRNSLAARNLVLLDSSPHRSIKTRCGPLYLPVHQACSSDGAAFNGVVRRTWGSPYSSAAVSSANAVSTKRLDFLEEHPLTADREYMLAADTRLNPVDRRGNRTPAAATLTGA